MRTQKSTRYIFVYFSPRISDAHARARRTIEEIFDGVYVLSPKRWKRANRLSSIRGRLKEILIQYEIRERHFECVIRSKELEVLLSRARAAEQKQLAEGEKTRSLKQEEEVCIHP